MMIIQRLLLENFKTYTKLDIDLSPEKDKPIILIGGANGGGKTTFFEAVYGALYGLNIKKEWQFRELVNAVDSQDLAKQYIQLEIYFSRPLTTETKNYKLKRTYKFHGDSVRENVEFKTGKNKFTYGSKTPIQHKIHVEQEIRKVIQANLPEELSRYFLFDAMEAGNLLRREKLETVIKENLEKVMGFDRYLQLEKATTLALESHNQKQIKQELDRKLYQKWLQQKAENSHSQKKVKTELKDALAFSVENKLSIDSLKSGIDQDSVLKEKINFLNAEIVKIGEKEAKYLEASEKLVQELDVYVGLPLIAARLKEPIQTILKNNKENSPAIKPELLKEIIDKIVIFLEQRKLLKQPIKSSELLQYLQTNETPENELSLFTEMEINALNKLFLLPKYAPYTDLQQQKIELEEIISLKIDFEKNLNYYQSKLKKTDFSMLEKYEQNENLILELQAKLKSLEMNGQELERQLLEFENETYSKNDSKQQYLQQLKTFFEQFSLKLLQAKKEKIEEKMKKGLNQMLLPYKDMIDRVELPGDLKNLTFRVHHINGNEIFLNQLNTASKQIVVQCLLKALHEHGNYQPPVMIDTVMGVLDEESRNIMLTQFLPNLAHQTIILSSDSEIREATDLPLIAPFIAKSYTLQRNVEQQKTEVKKGYFTRLSAI